MLLCLIEGAKPICNESQIFLPPLHERTPLINSVRLIISYDKRGRVNFTRILWRSSQRYLNDAGINEERSFYFDMFIAHF